MTARTTFSTSTPERGVSAWRGGAWPSRAGAGRLGVHVTRICVDGMRDGRCSVGRYCTRPWPLILYTSTVMALRTVCGVRCSEAARVQATAAAKG